MRNIDFTGSPFLELHIKMKKVNRALVEWSTTEYDNIFMQIATLDDDLLVKEAQFEISRSP